MGPRLAGVMAAPPAAVRVTSEREAGVEVEGSPPTFCANKESRAAHGELGKGIQGLIGTWSIRDPLGASGGDTALLAFWFGTNIRILGAQFW